MNISKTIRIDSKNITDKHFKIKLEQEVKTFEYLSMSINTTDAYQNFNSDYGVLVGRVIANGGIGIPNAKISIFIPISDEDEENDDIRNIYPYKTPRDKNTEGKRYNLLPRVSQYDPKTGAFKPKQPFGSFLIKPELVTNVEFLNVYKKYYKYTATTNDAGDYMIFGAPIGSQTIHLSVDITDIGKYSMTPTSMIQSGYPANLFTEDKTEIKPSQDLNDLPHIETQEITVDIIPFWGDVENFEIGITRQDFRIRANITADFYIFGTTMTMGTEGMFANPDKNEMDKGFYCISGEQTDRNNLDIRTYRTAKPIIEVFTYTEDILFTENDEIVAGQNIDYDKHIRKLEKNEYFEYNENGEFLLTIPCNRRKIITDESGAEIVVDDNSNIGIFSKFYGMILMKYPEFNELPQNSSFDNKFNGGNNCQKARGWFKIPQKVGLYGDENAHSNNNDSWRKEFQPFTKNEIYSVAQFLPTKTAINNANAANDPYENYFNFHEDNDYELATGGLFFRVEGEDFTTQSDIDTYNYITDPTTGGTINNLVKFKYDFPSNINELNFEKLDDNTNSKFFGAQWINLCLIFPQYGWAYSAGNNRDQNVADVYHNDYTSEFFVGRDNTLRLFAGLTNSRFLLRGDSFQTAFINIPREELGKLKQIPLKGINAYLWNNNLTGVVKYNGVEIDDIYQSTKLNYDCYKYKNVSNVGRTSQNYIGTAWDSNNSIYTITENYSNKSAYLFKGMYRNDCIKLLTNFNII